MTRETQNLTDEEMAEARKDEDIDRSVIRILTKPEDYGNEDFGPVAIMHMPQAGDILNNEVYAHVFGPYSTIRSALAQIKELDEDHGADHCYKVIMPFIVQPNARMIKAADLLRGRLDGGEETRLN